jgi:AraC-like DNA-binding protein
VDALSELLRAVKLSGAMFYNAACGAPWSLRSPPSRKLSEFVAAPSNHVIEFHMIVEGRGFVRVRDETQSFNAGDIVMIPHGDAHLMGNGSGSPTVDGEPMLPALLRREVLASRIGGNGEETRFMCGFLASDARLIQPVLASLPRIVVVGIRSDPSGAWLENMIRHAVEQAATGAPGNDVVLARLAEALFAEVLRLYLLRLPPGRSGWLAGAADPAVGRALAALHQRPSQAWTLDDLAKEVGMSRSALTERFSKYLGQGPMAYLTDWRLELAADALRTTNRSVLQIAEEVGYESEAAFNRAFKRRFEEPPGRYRRNTRVGAAGGE